MVKLSDTAKKRLLMALLVLLVVGIADSAFLLYEHFSSSADAFCTFGASFDCGVVNKSVYANLDGISYLLTIDWGLPLPLIAISTQHWMLDLLTSQAFLGLLTLIFMFLLVFSLYKGKSSLFGISSDHMLLWVRGFATFGLLYGMYLLYIQHSILQSYCIFCMLLDAVLLSTTVISWLLPR